jgi:hypothetical protein
MPAIAKTASNNNQQQLTPQGRVGEAPAITGNASTVDAYATA